MRFAEGDLEMEIPDVVDGGKFDGDGHGLNRCMKAVDFVVELADRYLFIEWVRLFFVGGPERSMGGLLRPAWQELLDPSEAGRGG